MSRAEEKKSKNGTKKERETTAGWAMDESREWHADEMDGWNGTTTNDKCNAAQTGH